MPTSQPVVQRQTIKQAKAAFKERGRPSISEKEQKQLQRSIELDRRAWGVRERERKKADALKKKHEKDRREKEDRERVRLGSQRRCDKFGYKSSQFHLGAFFGGNLSRDVAEKENVHVKSKQELEDAFGDDGVDDETLLDTLESPKLMKTVAQQPPSDEAEPSNLPRPAASLERSKSEPLPSLANELADFWDDLGTSTQIARELDVESNIPRSKPSLDNVITSFNSGDFDLTAEDLEELTPPIASKADSDKIRMPPPALPQKVRNAPAPTVVHSEPTARSSSPRLPGACGYSVAELESLVDDDLQLTQIAPG